MAADARQSGKQPPTILFIDTPDDHRFSGDSRLSKKVFDCCLLNKILWHDKNCKTSPVIFYLRFTVLDRIMIIDLVFASGDLRIRTRSTPAVRHAVDLARAVLALGSDGHLTVRKQGKRLPAIEFDGHYTPGGAIAEILRFTTNFETEARLAMLVRCVRRDATLKPRDRAAIIRRIAPTLTIDYER